MAPASPATAPAGHRDATSGCKVCLLGEPGMGKTSLIQRLAAGRFPASPPGPGITVSTHRFADGSHATFWDVEGSSAIDTLSQAFLSRVDAVAAVVDAGAGPAFDRALALIDHARRLYPHTAAALLINKCDLATGTHVAMPVVPGDIVASRVSARDGHGVEAAFATLVRAAAAQRARAR